MNKLITFLLLIFLAAACSNQEETIAEVEQQDNSILPFTTVAFDDMSAFAEASANWKTAGGVYVNRAEEMSLVAAEGTGILVNLPDTQKGNLFTNFKHGDIELEVDVMMPKGSNSGIYFQGRYEVQLFDSWGVAEAKHSDMGGIYQRWDDVRGAGKEGYEGFAPVMNAAKAPGLWQHFNIIFHAPKFDKKGKKIKNAEFESVWLNGALVQKNAELTGPTRASAFDDEQAEGPLMWQGDHGPVAFKNLKYKFYQAQKVTFANVIMQEYENKESLIPNRDTLELIREIKTDTISAAMSNKKKSARLLVFTGNLIVPETGDYRFDFRVHNGGGALIVGGDTLVNLNGLYNMDMLGFGKKRLEKGKVPFQLIYNKHLFWKQGFVLYAEGPGVQNHALHSPSSITPWDLTPQEKAMVEVADEAVLHRGFWMHEGKKRTHTISVGTAQNINYAYDLANGALLQVWNGAFVDAAKMWLGRGETQLSDPASFTVSFHGDPEFTALSDKNTAWPKNAETVENFSATGYNLDEKGLPTFNYKIGNTIISDKMIPSDGTRSVNRIIKVNGTLPFYHKIAEGEAVEKLPDGTFIINDESYFINFSDTADPQPFVRKSNGREELLIEIPAGDHTLNYAVTW